MSWQYVFVYLIPSIVAIISLLLVNIKGTDHYYHELIIGAIKKNKNKFVLSNPNIIGENRMAYPQFLHWILSFFDIKKITKYALWVNLLSTILSSIFLYLFINKIIEYSGNEFWIANKSKIVFSTGLAYISFPFNYDMVNAKNTGISARGIGLFLGQLYLYLISLYFITQNHFLLIVLVPICIIILISSAFAMQFLLFGTTIITLLSLKAVIIVPLLIAFIIIYSISKSYFKMFFVGQFTHKKLYSKYLAERYILKSRYSIWRDLIYDFWALLFDKNISIIDKLKYITSNSIVVVISSMPFILFSLLFLLYKNEIPYYLAYPAISCFIIFLIITFRKSRFLGEPERYLEFGFGFFSLIAAIAFFDYKVFYYALLTYSICFVIFRLVFYINYTRKNKNVIGRNNAQEAKNKLISIIENEKLSNVKVLSNSTQYSKILLSTKWKTFWHPLFQEKVGSFHFIDLFEESYDYITPSKIKDVIKELNINFFLCDFNKINSKNEFLDGLTIDNIKLSKINTFGEELILYKICLKS